MQAACLPQASVAQLVREAALREEWRAGRESSLMESLRSQALRGLLGSSGGKGTGWLSAADGRLLAEHVATFTEMMEQEQQRRRQRAPAGRARLGSSYGRAGGAAYLYGRSSDSSASPRSPAHALPSSPQVQPYLVPLGPQPQSPSRPAATWAGEGLGRQRRSSTGPPLLRSASAGAAHGSAGTPQQRQPQHPGQQRLSGNSVASAATAAAAVALYGAAAKPGTAAGSPIRALRGGTGGGGRRASGPGGGASWIPMHQQQRRQDPGQAGWPLSGSRPRPGSAPEEFEDGGGAARVGSALDPVVAAAAAATAAAAAAVNAPGGQAGDASGATPGQRCSGFRNLLRLQQLLMQGLRAHAVQDGEGCAMEALHASVAEGQAFFADCLAEALEAAGLPTDAAGGRDALHTGRGGPSAGGGGGAGSLTRRLPAAAWDRLLRLGELGLTRGDVARLEGIRRQQAARTIQRQVRRWLRHRRHQRRVVEARARADAMQRKLRERAAIAIQAWVRGHLARRLVARLAAQAARQRAAQRLEDAVRSLAATRIQRAWRAHRRARRYAEALARAEERRCRDMQQQQRGTQALEGMVAQGAATGERSDGVKDPSWMQSAPAGIRRVAPSAQQLEHAAVVIQAHLRGWLVRRSSALWWARACQGLRERRAAVRAWQQHQRFMEASYDLQAQMLGAMVREAQVVAALQADRRRQEADMQEAFNEWLVQQQRVALSQPLPRGWVPHPHPEDPARMCFLNTRTGDLHSLHPALAELARHANDQHAAAAAALARRFSGVPAYVQRLHSATEQQAAIAMRSIAVMYQRAAGGQQKQQQQQQEGGKGERRGR